VRTLIPISVLLVLALAAGGVRALAGHAHAQEQESTVRTSLPDLRPSADWQVIEMPEDKNGARARAWSDPAGGCHLALFSLPIPESAAEDKILESMSAALASKDYQLVAIENDDKPKRLTLSGFGVTGLATLRVPDGQVRKATLLACFWNEREPLYCRSQCEAGDRKLRAAYSGDGSEAQP
jgi:hypothetical protein